MLPAKPKIFYGRDLELEEIMVAISQESPHVAILGGGGMGKTTLAKAVLHHPEIITKYDHRFFVPADSATSSTELATQIGFHIGLKPARDLTRPVVQYFADGPSALLILDNFETPWEPMESRGKVEEFLSLLADVAHLALIVSQRSLLAPCIDLSTDHNARGREASESSLDTSIFAALGSNIRQRCSKDLHGHYR
jgi:hypothetical protein